MNQHDSFDGSKTLRPTQMLNTLRDALAARRKSTPNRPARPAGMTVTCRMRSVRSRFSSLKRLCLNHVSESATVTN